MFPTIIRQQPCEDGCDGKNSNQPQATCASTSAGTAGTNTTKIDVKLDVSSFSKYINETGCVKVALTAGGFLMLKRLQFPGQGVTEESMAGDQWVPAGRGAMFSFLPFLQSLNNQSRISDKGSVQYSQDGSILPRNRIVLKMSNNPSC